MSVLWSVNGFHSIVDSMLSAGSGPQRTASGVFSEILNKHITCIYHTKNIIVI